MDISGTIDTNETLAPGDSISSDLSAASDVDWFALSGVNFGEGGIISFSTTADTSNAKIDIYRMIDERRNIFEKIESHKAQNDGSFDDFFVNSSYDHFIAVTGFSGSYTIEQSTVAEAATYFDQSTDDQGGVTETIQLDAQVTGTLDHKLDVDTFEIDLVGGTAYSLDITDGFYKNSINGGGDIVILSPNGSYVMWNSGQSGTNTFVVDETGTFTIELSYTADSKGLMGEKVEAAYSNDYAFSIESLGAAVIDGGDTVATATNLAVGVEHSVQLGQRGSGADGQYFSFDGIEGRRYLVEVNGVFARVDFVDANGFTTQGYQSKYNSSSVMPNGESIAHDLSGTLLADGTLTFSLKSWHEFDNVDVKITELPEVDETAIYSLTPDVLFHAEANGPSDFFGWDSQNQISLDVVEGEFYTLTWKADTPNDVTVTPSFGLTYDSAETVEWSQVGSSRDGVRVFQFVAVETGTVNINQYTGSGTRTNSDGTKINLTEYIGGYTLEVTTGITDDRPDPFSSLSAPMATNTEQLVSSFGEYDEDAFVVFVETGKSYTFVADAVGYVYSYKTDATLETGWTPYSSIQTTCTTAATTERKTRPLNLSPTTQDISSSLWAALQKLLLTTSSSPMET